MNQTNKSTWDEKFGRTFSESELKEFNIVTVDEDGGESDAIPVNYDDGQNEYDAVRDILENALIRKEYKIWKVGDPLREYTTQEKFEEFDVLYLVDKSWEYFLFPALLYSVNEEESTVTLKYINYRDDEIKTETVKYKDGKDS